MSYQIHTETDGGYEPLFPIVIRSASAAFVHLAPQPGEATILLTSVERIQDLNQRFAGHDYPTDVLSFSDGTLDEASRRIYYGDIVIAVPIAEQQAEQAGHTLEAEIALLTVHGVLHLLGQDHATSEEQQAMWELQAAILQQLPMDIVLPGDAP